MVKEGLLIVISGPSGTGKGTVCRALLDANREMVLSVSKTTRQPRTGEQDGVNYFFVEREEFMRSIENNDFLEYADVYGQFYGTPRNAVNKMLEAGRDVLLEIDPQGAMQVMARYPEGLYIFLVPPSGAELRSRIMNRGTETPEQLKKRLSAAAAEIAMAPKYQYIVVNDMVEEAKNKIQTIIQAEKLQTRRNMDLLCSIAKEVIL